MSTGRRLPAVLAYGATCAVMLSSCTPPVMGVTGIVRTADGTFDVVVQTCQGDTVDHVVLFGSIDRSSERLHTWELADPIDGLGTIEFDDDLVQGLDPGTECEIGAWGPAGASSDNAGGPTFTSEELADLGSGQVIAGFWPSDDPRRTFDDLDRFVRAAEDFCRTH